MNKRKKPKFVRKDSYRISRLGKRRKKKLKWRRPKGKHSKIREKRKGYLKKPSIGYGSPKKERKELEKKIKRIYNVVDLESCTKEDIVIIGHVGKKKREEILKKAKEKGINILNIRKKSFLEKNENVEKPKEDSGPSTQGGNQ